VVNPEGGAVAASLSNPRDDPAADTSRQLIDEKSANELDQHLVEEFEHSDESSRCLAGLKRREPAERHPTRTRFNFSRLGN
jgi:hypothetical protein